MFTENDVRELAEFETGGHLATSLYFHAPDVQTLARKGQYVALKDLFREAAQQWNHDRVPSERVQSLQHDSERILDFLAKQNEVPDGRVDHALFSCSALGFYKAFPLRRGFSHWGRSPETSVCVAPGFCVRPLVELMDLYPRQCVVVIDRERARMYEVNMGEIEDRRAIHDEVPAQVRESGWGGYLERRIERHIDEEVHRHYERAVNELQALYRKHHFERLLLGGPKEAISAFEENLPEELRRRVVGRFPVDRTASGEQVTEKALELGSDYDRAEKEQLVQILLDNIGPMGSAVVGLDATINALLKREVQILLVGDGCCAGGKKCPHCGFLGAVVLTECPHCEQKLEQVEDLVDEAVRRAIIGNAQVRFINDNAALERAGNIGAILRFRAERRAS